MLTVKREAPGSTTAPMKDSPARRSLSGRESGFSLIEVLVSGVILTLLLATFARMGIQSERNNTSLSAATLAADTAAMVGAEVQAGNPAVTPGSGTTYLSAALLATLSPTAGQREQIAATGITGTVTAIGGNPPLYQVSVVTAGMSTVVTTIGPGGSD